MLRFCTEYDPKYSSVIISSKLKNKRNDVWKYAVSAYEFLKCNELLRLLLR